MKRPVGKPPRAGKASLYRVVVLLTEDERAAIDAAVIERDQSISELVRAGLQVTGVIPRTGNSALGESVRVQVRRLKGDLT